MWANEFKDYVSDPRRAWPAGRERQVAKLERGLRRISRSRKRAARRIVAVARQRAAPQTLFVVNCGSSGSHWLTTMLDEFDGMADCGEVYLPAGLLADVRSWDNEGARAAFLDSVHLAHHPRGQLRLDETLINSAHTSGWRMARSYGAAAKVVLLVRDPLDITISRTLRKAEYRQDVAPGVSDDEYLTSNVAFVKRFFAAAEAETADLIVSYEEIRADAVRVLRRIRDLMGLSATESQLQQVAAKHREGSLTTNVYRGPRIEPPPAMVADAARKLEPVRRAWGYAGD